MSTRTFSTPLPGLSAPEGTSQWPGPEQSAALPTAGEAGLRAAGWLRDLVGQGEPRCLLGLAGDIARRSPDWTRRQDRQRYYLEALKVLADGPCETIAVIYALAP
ncbi:hypothetical protein ACFXOY_28165 [Streptomyces niveus]|uniref:hypothetical protein n=1 Tax=Streptomyces niveus TaxID=193462 RepID=UPI0036797D8B